MKNNAKDLVKQANLIKENQALFIKAKDRLRKYNKRYGTTYKINEKSIDLTDPGLGEKLALITTANIKKGVMDKMPVIERYEINGIRLSKEEYQEMMQLQKKANRIRGKREDGSDYYTPFFQTKQGYYRYIEVLKGMQTRQQYLSHMVWQLQTFKQNLLNHLDDLLSLAKDENDAQEINELYDWCSGVLNTYSRLDKLYKYLLKNGYTGEQMSRLFFDSDPDRRKFAHGEDVTFLTLLKNFKKSSGWTAPLNKNRLSQLEKDNPLTID